MLLSLARSVSESARSVSGISIAVSQVHSCHRPTDSKIKWPTCTKKNCCTATNPRLTFYAPWNIPPNISPSSPLTFHHISLWHLSIFSFGIHLYFTLTSHHIFLWHPSVFFSASINILRWLPAIFSFGIHLYFTLTSHKTPLASIHLRFWCPSEFHPNRPPVPTRTPIQVPSQQPSDLHPDILNLPASLPPVFILTSRQNLILSPALSSKKNIY